MAAALVGFMFTLAARGRAERKTLPAVGIEGGIRRADAWKEIHSLSRHQKHSFQESTTEETLRVCDWAYDEAVRFGSVAITPAHFFLALLKSPDIQQVFLRLLLPTGALEAKVKQLIGEKEPHAGEPILEDAGANLLFYAYSEAAKHRHSLVLPTDLLASALLVEPRLQEALFDLGVDTITVQNVIAWARLRETMRQEYVRSSQAAVHVSKHGIDRAMTAVATPYLASMSTDLTLRGKYHQLRPCVNREKEVEEIFRAMESGKGGVLLVGEYGVGKMSIVEGVVERIITGDCPNFLKEKRVLLLSPSALLSGATTAEAEARLARVVGEAAKAKNVMIVVPNMHDLTASSADGESLDISEALSEWVSRGLLTVIATSTPEGFERHVVHTRLMSSMAVVQVAEPEDSGAIPMLEAHVGNIEYQTGAFVTYEALRAAATSAGKFMHDSPLPSSAIELLREAATLASRGQEKYHLVRATHVGRVVTDKTGVPESALSHDEAKLLLTLEQELHKTMIGQYEAVSVVSQALRRARTSLTSDKRPLATFLFLGPTGVGKTELAKTIARVYFGGEERMLRFDMSEFQDTSAVYRLIGEPGKPGTGLLTEAVREKPFRLILLDELEKADKGVLNLFLQVFDDGRLTDSMGHVIDFRSTMIIATSNAGSAFIKEKLAEGETMANIRTALVHEELKQVYRPEFLNRFDGVVVFTPLQKEDIRAVAKLMMKEVEARLDERGIELRIDDGAWDTLISKGYDVDFGARPMRRAIQDTVENAIAEKLLEGNIARRDTIIVQSDLSVRLEKPA
jgi:ATP-dependent Clp protease ATP-binding subunit ClpC